MTILHHRSVFLLAGILWAAVARPAAGADLVREGRARARILLPEVAGHATLFAAEELRGHIERMSGARLPLLFAEVPIADETLVVLEPRRLEGDIQADGREDRFVLETRGNRLTIAGESELAVLYGVYQVLEDLGVRWFTPGELGMHCPPQPTLPLPSYHPARAFSPSFRTRELDLSGTRNTHFDRDPARQPQLLQEYALWLLRNRVHHKRVITTRHLPQPFGFGQGREFQGHNLRRTALRGAVFAEAPERFPLVTQASERWGRDGVAARREGGATQICFTHPDNLATAIASVRTYFETHPQHLTYPLGLEDHAGICECPGCVKANGDVFPPHDPNRLVWAFLNAVADGVATTFPTRKISVYSPYGSMTRPPAGMRVSSNIVAVAAQVTGNHLPVADPGNTHAATYLEHIRLTQAAGADLGIRTYTMYPGTPQPLAILDSMRTFHGLGANWYHCESMGRDEHRWIVTWALARLAWDVSREPQELLREFCDTYYGAAGDLVLEVLGMLDEAVRGMPVVVLGSLGASQSILSEALIVQLSTRLAAARARVEGREAERLGRLIDSIDMMAARARAARACFRAMDTRSDASIQQAQAAIDAFAELWKERDLSLTCSPSLLDEVTQRLQGHVAKLREPMSPQRGAHVGTGTPAILLEEAFSMATVPAPPPADLFILPEHGRFKLDIDRQGVAQAWMRADLDDSGWREISTWNFYERQGYDPYDGDYWYRIRFQAPPLETGRRIILRIGALDDGGDVYLNGKLAHTREHLSPLAWQESFTVDVTALIRPGEDNILAIHGQDHYGMGGLWKPVVLYTQP
ncbi:MAG: DUF4838 domain-containing protein [Lentisphaerae bacterium]|nr:DUF4838 domain-containing protein [Lentisphaerota bacterium]